jgi:signal transduction histidine kinase
MASYRFRSGLSVKFILLTTLLIVLTSLTLGLFFLKSKEIDYLGFLQERGIALSRTLAFNAEFGILTKNAENLDKLIQGVMMETDVTYCIVHDANGSLMSESYKDPALKKLIPETLLQRALILRIAGAMSVIQPFSIRELRLEGYDIATVVKTRRLTKSHAKGEFFQGYLGILDEIRKKLNIQSQITEEKIGTVRVGISLNSLHESMKKTTRTIGVITLLVSFLGVLITTFLVQFIIRPIHRLVYGTRQIARGDLSHEVKVNSRDEIGELANSFNQMTLFLRKSHDQLEEYNKNLEHMVEERTRKLQETRAELIRSEKFAAIGELITGISHELNNKLTPILGYAQIFKTMNMDEKIMKYMDVIEESALNAKKIVESLLRFSRTSPPQKIYTDLNKTLRETLVLIEPHIRKNNIQLEMKLDEKLPMTMADPGLISQAFLNILNNACQAMEEKGGKLRVASHQHDQKIFFTVRDTGIGIPKENLSRIFDPFFTTKEVGKGTGLGLSISYGILQNHDGNIHVESIIGQGSVFTIEIPVKSPASPAPARSSPIERELGRSAKILIVEDESSIQTFLSDILGRENSVKTASNGKEAQEIILKEKFDIYMVDLRMPVMNGMELYEWLHTHFPAETKKVILITGDTYDQKTQVFLGNVHCPQVSKPFQIETLQNVMAEILNR